LKESALDVFKALDEQGMDCCTYTVAVDHCVRAYLLECDAPGHLCEEPSHHEGVLVLPVDSFLAKVTHIVRK
jgi:hypothetical protein